MKLHAAITIVANSVATDDGSCIAVETFGTYLSLILASEVRPFAPFIVISCLLANQMDGIQVTAMHTGLNWFRVPLLAIAPSLNISLHSVLGRAACLPNQSVIHGAELHATSCHAGLASVLYHSKICKY